MATAKKQSKASDASSDAIQMLVTDHKTVKDLFAQFQKMREDGSDDEKSAIVQEICNALTVHAEIEEQIFYPAVREAIEDSDLMDEALVEHAGAKSLIAQLQEMDPEDDLYDAKVTVLGEQIAHHVEEEEGVMFPKATKAKIDTAALGAAMLERKTALMEKTGLGDEVGDTAEDEEEDEVTRAKSPKVDKKSTKVAKSN
jgi:hemerythrin superfamily protein